MQFKFSQTDREYDDKGWREENSPAGDKHIDIIYNDMIQIPNATNFLHKAFDNF